MREALSTDFGSRVALPAVDLVWLPSSLSLPAAGESRPAWHSRVVMTGSSGGHAELWVLGGQTRAALVEMIGPKESDVPAAVARAVAASAVLP